MRRSLLSAAPLVALFIAALVANLRLLGSSPIVWVDTFNDEGEVRECIANDSCTLTGMSTAIEGQAAAVAWLELRTLLAWIGVGIEGAHLAIVFLNALAVVLVFHLATQLANPIAGVAAVLIFLDRIQALVRVTALHNSSLLFFLGAVLVLSCTAAVARPGFASIALAALVGAVMANVHLACLLTGPSVVWVALTAPRRRFLLAAFGAALFALATFLLAPPTWLHNLMSVLEHGAARGPSTAAMRVASNPVLSWSLFAVSAWVVSLAGRAPSWVAYRRLAQGAMAVLVPLLAAFLVGSRLGLRPEAKYLFHAKAACAVAAALPLGIAAGALLRAVSPRRLLLAVDRILPFALALAIALPGVGVGAGEFTADDERTPTIRDLAAVGRILRDDRGWSVGEMLARLKTPYGAELLVGLRQMTGAGEGGAAPAAAGDGALLLALEADGVPEPLPSTWTVVSRKPHSLTVLISAPSRIDWNEFTVCAEPADGSAQRCEKSGWRPDAEPFVPNMPPTGWRGRLELTLPLRRAAAGEIFMPRASFVCGGRIASGSGGGVQVEADRRHATIAASETGAVSPSTITLEWEVGSPECDALAYDGLPPFFVDGDPATVRLLDAMLRKREG